MRKVNYHFFHEPMDLVHVLIAVASQENHDTAEYDLMILAADYIRELERVVDAAKELVCQANLEFHAVRQGEAIVHAEDLRALTDTLKTVER
jgi:hypothetical protein